ncbi:MAG: alpha/beta fold hydrolase [Flectobacillus sp.]|uniref:alpha/beta fold hydrolase n=1 Tax=Flectobacillus sp. TaxID=50419 RepID=UPI003B9A13CE
MKPIILLLICISCVSLKAQTIHFFQSFDQQRIAYEDTGKGKPVLLLHGFINTGANWRRTELYKDLITKGYRVIVPDMRGNGKSDKPHEEKFYQHNAETKDMMALMKFLQIKDYFVIGYSRGAIIAAKLISLDKGVKKAVLGGIGQYFTKPDWARRKMFEEAFLGKAHLHPEAQGAVMYAKSIGADTLVLGYLQRYQPATSPNALANYKGKVMIINGDADLDNGDPKVLQGFFKNAKLSIIKGDHNGTYRTAEFSNEILKFLEE